MDTIVPSPNLLNTPFASSPHSFSIYEQEKQNTFWADPKIKNVDMSSLTTEEGDPLDDHFEDSSLKNFFSPELLNSVASSSGVPPTYVWENKYNSVESQGPSSDPSFNQLGVDPELFISDLFLNIDSNDSKFSCPAFDFEMKSVPSNPSSSCQTPVPSDSKSDLTELSAAKDNISPFNKELSNKESIGAGFLNKNFSMKTNFPPRKSQPPIGIVSPVKIQEDAKSFSNFGDIKMEMKDLKSENRIDLTELPPQTVPSFGVTNQDGNSLNVKQEPSSPEFNQRKGLHKRSSYDAWEDFSHFTNTKRKRYDSGSSGQLSDEGDEEDNDFNDDSDDDNSDLDADLAHMKPGGCESLIGGGKKQKQYFWQYNVQAKGPKGTRLKLAVEAPTDPHVLNSFEDPVFDEGNTMLAGIRHGGKARKGDGNEVTPNPQKLFRIGHQLLRLNRKINACQLGSDIPLEKRNESRKEKNKLASRACRLKKKAQHEAHKIKLNGLEMEHSQINNVLRLIWPELREKAKNLQNQQRVCEQSKEEINLTSKLTDYISSNLKSMVAGNTTDYVNNVILAVEQGDVSGGLRKTKKT